MLEHMNIKYDIISPSSSAPTLFRPLSTPLKPLDISKKQPYWCHSHVLLLFGLPLPPPSMVRREALGDFLAQPRLHLVGRSLGQNMWKALQCPQKSACQKGLILRWFLRILRLCNPPFSIEIHLSCSMIPQLPGTFANVETQMCKFYLQCKSGWIDIEMKSNFQNVRKIGNWKRKIMFQKLL